MTGQPWLKYQSSEAPKGGPWLKYAQAVQQDNSPQEKPGFFENIGNQWNTRKQKAANIPSTDTMAGQGLQTLGAGMGLAGDIGADVSGAIGKGAYNIAHPVIPELTDLIANAPGNIAKFVGPTAKENLGPAAQYVKQKYNEYVPEGTETRRNVEALGNIGRGELNTVPLLQGAQAIAPAIPKIAKGLGETAGDFGSNLMSSMKSEAIPTAKRAFAESDKAYAALDKSGTVLSPQGVKKFVQAAKTGADLDPQVLAVFPNSETASLLRNLQTLADSGQPVKIQTLHKIVKNLNQTINKHFKDGLDETGYELLNVKESILRAAKNPEHLTGGPEGFHAWEQANQFFTEGSRLDHVERIIKRANRMKNPAASLQTGFRQLAESAKKTRGWSEEQLAALDHAAETGKVGDLLQTFSSRLIPIAAGATGTGVGGIPGAIVAGAVGQGISSTARAGAKAVQMGRANSLARSLGTDAKFTPMEPVPAPPSPQGLLAAPDKMSALPMTDAEIAIAQALLRKSSETPNSISGGAIIPESTNPKLLPSPENMSRLPMTDKQIAIARALMEKGPVQPQISGGAIPIDNTIYARMLREFGRKQ